jgi:hypothetical protein
MVHILENVTDEDRVSSFLVFLPTVSVAVSIMHVLVRLPQSVPISSFLLSLLSLTIDIPSADIDEVGVIIDLDNFSSICSCWTTDVVRGEGDSDASAIIVVVAVCVLVRILVSDQVFL